LNRSVGVLACTGILLLSRLAWHAVSAIEMRSAHALARTIRGLQRSCAAILRGSSACDCTWVRAGFYFPAPRIYPVMGQLPLCVLDRSSPGNEYRLAGDPTRLIRSEKRHRRCDVFRLSGPSEWCSRNCPLFEIASRYPCCLNALGNDQPRVDRIHANL